MSAGDPRPIQGAVDGRTRLILAAEALFATRGINGVSDREILAAAGHRNNSAIRYHFGSRQDLLDAIWYLHTTPINLHRAEMIARLPGPGLETTRQLMEAHVHPFVTGLLSYTPSYWARFNEQYLIHMPTQFFPIMNREIAAREEEPPLQVLALLYARIRQHLTGMSVDEAGERVALTVRWVVNAFANWERDVEAGIADREALPRLALTIIDLSVVLLDAPATRNAHNG